MLQYLASARIGKNCSPQQAQVQKLDEYTENIEYITVAKEQLEQDYADLENMKANVESQKQSVAALMSQKETERTTPYRISEIIQSPNQQ